MRSPYEPGSPEDFGWVSDHVGNMQAMKRQINAACARILARGDEGMDERMTVDEAVAMALMDAARINAETTATEKTTAEESNE